MGRDEIEKGEVYGRLRGEKKGVCICVSRFEERACACVYEREREREREAPP